MSAYTEQLEAKRRAEITEALDELIQDPGLMAFLEMDGKIDLSTFRLAPKADATTTAGQEEGQQEQEKRTAGASVRP